MVNGTRIISSRVLDSIGCPIINTHAGITPRYRGVHGGYWALAEGHPEEVGTTVHLVDKGIEPVESWQGPASIRRQPTRSSHIRISTSPRDYRSSSTRSVRS